MSDATQQSVPATGAVNEFGSPQTNAGLGAPPLNDQGQQTSLDDILAAVRGIKVPEQPRTPDQAPPAAEQQPATDPVNEDGIDTGNKALDLAVKSFLRSSGATQGDLERAVANALQYNDPNLIDKAFLQDKFKDKAGDAIALAEAVLEQVSADRDRLVNSAYDAAGGKEAWDAAKAAYDQLATPALKRVVGEMFRSGDQQAFKEATDLVLSYARQSGALPTVEGAKVVPGSGSAGAQGLSAAEFQSAISKLNQSSRTYVQDYNKLIELRRVGKQLGK